MSEMPSWEETIRSIVAEELERLDRGQPAVTAPVNDVMTADEAAEFLRLDRKTVYGYAKRGVIPHQAVGRRMLFSRTALVSWLGACKAASNRKGS
jgi:excisionase family DNA binding protein